MKKKTIGIVLAAVLSMGALAAVAADVAEHHGHGRHGRGEMFMGKEMESRLNLTADQKAKLEQMHQRQREQMKAQFAEGPKGHQALMQEIFKDNPNPAVIQQQVAAMQQQQSARLAAHVQAMQDFNSILTPDQRVQMQQLMAERQQKMQEWQSKREQRHQEKQNQTPKP